MSEPAVNSQITDSVSQVNTKVLGDAPAIAYDAPSAKARKLFVASRDYPIEVIVNVEGWVKVRDAAGDLGCQLGRELALLLDALDDGFAALLQFAQIAQPVLELAQLHVVEPARKWRHGAAG